MKHKITDKWYVVQIWLEEKKEWHDRVDNDLTRREARSQFVNLNCLGHKGRIIERIAAFKVVAEKDFRRK
jgi:hypothetical protein